MVICCFKLESKIGTSLVLYSGCKDKVSNLTTHHAMRCVDKWTQRISRYMVPCSLMFSGFSISKYCRQNYILFFYISLNITMQLFSWKKIALNKKMKLVDKWTQRISRYMVPCCLMFSGFSTSKCYRQNYSFYILLNITMQLFSEKDCIK